MKAEKRPIAPWSLCAAITSALLPAAVVSLTLAPASSRARAVSTLPWRAANSSAVSRRAPSRSHLSRWRCRRCSPVAANRRPRVKVRAGLDQGTDDVGMPLIGGPHQRRLPAQALFGVHVRAASREQGDSGDVAAPGRGHQGCLAGLERDVWCGARIEEPPHESVAAVEAGQPQRRGAQVVRRIHVGAGTDQQVGGDQVVAVSGPLQCRGPVPLGGVDVGPGLQRRAEPFGEPLRTASMIADDDAAPAATSARPPSRPPRAQRDRGAGQARLHHRQRLNRQASCAVAELIDPHTHPVEQRQMQVRQRRVLRERQVTAAGDLLSPPTSRSGRFSDACELASLMPAPYSSVSGRAASRRRRAWSAASPGSRRRASRDTC